MLKFELAGRSGRRPSVKPSGGTRQKKKIRFSRVAHSHPGISPFLNFPQPGSRPSQGNAGGESRRAKSLRLACPLPVVSCPLCGVIISHWPAWCLTVDSINALQRRKRLPRLCQSRTMRPLHVVVVLFSLLFL